MKKPARLEFCVTGRVWNCTQMQCTSTATPGQAAPSRRNFPATVEEAEAYFDQTAMPRQIETIGQWVNPPPNPLPEAFLRRLVASYMDSPQTWGRVFEYVKQAGRPHA